MVLIVGGAPVGAKKVPTGERSPRRRGHDPQLPKIPHSGPTSLLSSNILLSKIEEIRWSEEQHSRQPQRSQISTAPLCSPRYQSKAALEYQQRSLLHNLHTRDCVQTPRYLDTILSAHCDSRPNTGSKTGEWGYQEDPLDLLVADQEEEDEAEGDAAGMTSMFAPSAFFAGRALQAPATLSSSRQGLSSAGSAIQSSPSRVPRPQGESMGSSARLHTASTASRLHTASTASRLQTASSSCRPGVIPGQALRLQHLRQSFRNSQREIASRLMELDQMLQEQSDSSNRRNSGTFDVTSKQAAQQALAMARIGLEPSGVRKSRSATPEAAAGTETQGKRQLDTPCSATGSEYEEANQLIEDDLKTALPETFRAFDHSAVGFIAPKPVVNLRAGAGRDEQGVIQTHASNEEVEYALALLNFHRWLCGLPAVTINENCMRVCEILNQALLPRMTVLLKPSMPQFHHITRFADTLGQFIAHEGRCIVLHGDASLFDCIDQCLLSCHAPKNDASPILPPHERDFYDEEVIDRVQTRAENYRKSLPAELGGKAQFNVIIPGMGPLVVGLHDLPHALESFRAFWVLTEQRTSNKIAPDEKAGHEVHVSHPSQTRLRTKKVDRSAIKTRSLAWCQEREKKTHAKSGVFWGDRERKILFRRYLLNPELQSFGASRANDTCTMWTGKGQVPSLEEIRPCDGLSEPSKPAALSDLTTQKHELEASFPDVVCYPPAGWFPCELLHGIVPTWTLMPNCQRYQPTQNLNVCMWRVRIASGNAERLSAVGVSSLLVDCSAKGNPFCVMFQPELLKIEEGDQFEVELNGLTGPETKVHVFHEFRSFQADHLDYRLISAAQDFVSVVEQPLLWKHPAGRNVIKAPQEIQKVEPEAKPKVKKSARVSVGTGPGREFHAASARAAKGPKLPGIELLSHPALTFTTDSVDITISIYCPGVKVLKPRLNLLRASVDSGKVEIHRATWVLKCESHYIIRVKFPMTHCKYELTFRSSLPSAPDVLIEHATKYNITTSEAVPNLLISLDHALKDKFGFTFQTPFVQAHGITVVAPVLHRVRSGFAYFLVHVDSEAYSQADPRNKPEPYGTSLFSHRLAAKQKDMVIDESDKSHHQSSRTNLSNRGSCAATTQAATCVCDTFHKQLQNTLEPCVQDSRHSVHIDISVLRADSSTQRYVKRLHRRTDLPEFYERLLWFSDSDAECVVEMMLRFPRTQAHQYSPLKIGEWRLTRKDEDFPAGF